MEWGDPGEALRAKAEPARRTAIREAERLAVEAARAEVGPAESFLHCRRCNAVWRADAVAEAVRGEPRCLLCGGPLAPVP